MKDIIEIVKSLKDSGLLLKGVVKQFKMKLKNKNWISWYIIRYLKRKFIRKYFSG